MWDMNSAYLWALTQPLADYTTKEECSIDDIFKKKYDYYSFENDLHRIIYYKEQIDQMQGAMFWADVKIYGYKSKIFFKKTAAELYALKQINKDFYKNVANLTVGCMHKRNGERNSATLAGSLYAYFEWFISDLVAKLKKKKYNVIMVTTDSIKLAGKYNEEDNIFPVGLGLGEFKLEYEGESKYYSIGHYEENTVKWKGKPKYLRDGNKPCLFVSNLKQEAKIYEQYAEK